MQFLDTITIDDTKRWVKIKSNNTETMMRAYEFIFKKLQWSDDYWRGRIIIMSNTGVEFEFWVIVLNCAATNPSVVKWVIDRFNVNYDNVRRYEDGRLVEIDIWEDIDEQM